MSIRHRNSLAVFLLLLCFAVPAHADRLLEADALTSGGLVEEALKKLRAEFADPQFTSQKGRGVFLPQRMLISLGDYAALVAIKSEIEVEARKRAG